MLICETWFKKIPKPQNYKLQHIQKQQPRNQGLALPFWSKKQIKHYQLNSTPNPIEHTSIQISTTHTNYKILSLYYSPKHNITAKNLDDVIKDPCPTIAIGDLNAKHKK